MLSYWLDGEKPTICLEDLESLLQLRGLTLPISSGRTYVLGNLSACLLYIFCLLII